MDASPGLSSFGSSSSSSSLASPWRPLSIWHRQLTASSGEPQPTSPPPLLASISCGTSSYTVYVTDLVNVWYESLDRKAICMRGFKEDTSLDPSDGPNNMTAFLRSLERAFNSLEPDHHTTAITVSPPPDHGKSKSSQDDLTLTITCKLPPDLTPAPLRWNMYLQRRSNQAPSHALTSQIVYPLLLSQQKKIAEVDSLISLLQQKDVVISKLLDKLEHAGITLEACFPSLANRRKVSRAAAGERVPGLVPFRPTTWSAGVTSLGSQSPNGNSSSSLNTVLRDVFGEVVVPSLGVSLSPSSTSLAADHQEVENGGKWWLNLGPLTLDPADELPIPGSVTLQSQEQTSASANTKESPTRGDGSDNSDVEFESGTASSLNTPQKSKQAPLTRDDTFISKAKESSPTPTISAQDATTSTGRKPLGRIGRLGKIGGGSGRMAKPSFDSSSDSEDNSHVSEKQTPAQNAGPSSAGSSAILRQGLGKIGSARRNENTDPSQELKKPSLPEEETDTEYDDGRSTSSAAAKQPVAKKPASVIGKIGGIGSHRAKANHESSARPSPRMRAGFDSDSDADMGDAAVEAQSSMESSSKKSDNKTASTSLPASTPPPSSATAVVEPPAVPQPSPPKHIEKKGAGGRPTIKRRKF